MPRGKLVSKADMQRTAVKPAAKRGRPPKSEAKVARKQSIAKVTRAAKPAVKPKAVERPHQPGISITVQIPALRRPKDSTQKKATVAPAHSRRKLIPLAIIPVVAAIAVGGFVFLPRSKHAPAGAVVVEAAARTAPNYQPLMLADQKPNSQSYDGRRNMVGFTTSFSGVRVTVSEQALPDNFGRDPTALLRAADGLNAKQHVDTDRGPLFIATNDTAGDQMGIFADKQVLCFIHTDHRMDETSWKSFVEQLKPADWQNTNNTSGS